MTKYEQRIKEELVDAVLPVLETNDVELVLVTAKKTQDKICGNCKRCDIKCDSCVATQFVSRLGNKYELYVKNLK